MVPDSETEKSGRKDELIMAHTGIFFPESINSIKIKNKKNLAKFNFAYWFLKNGSLLDVCKFIRGHKKP